VDGGLIVFFLSCPVLSCVAFVASVGADGTAFSQEGVSVSMQVLCSDLSPVNPVTQTALPLLQGSSSTSMTLNFKNGILGQNMRCEFQFNPVSPKVGRRTHTQRHLERAGAKQALLGHGG